MYPILKFLSENSEEDLLFEMKIQNKLPTIGHRQSLAMRLLSRFQIL